MQSIVNGIHALEAIGVDVMIVGRGGGSIEDLWAFNEEAVAQAIFDCEIPIISAVGHETGTTIADFVADMRAPTPSAAAELAVFEIERVEEQLQASANRLYSLMQMRLQNYKARVVSYEARLKTMSPENKLREQRMRLMRLEEKMEALIDGRLESMRHRLALAAGKLDGLSPLKKLSSGYAFLRDTEGKSIKDIHDITMGDEVQFHVIGGYAKAKVTEVCEQ